MHYIANEKLEGNLRNKGKRRREKKVPQEGKQGTQLGEYGEKQKGNEDFVSQSVVDRRITGFHVTGSSDVPLFSSLFLRS